jgi:hypothetical protein
MGPDVALLHVTAASMWTAPIELLRPGLAEVYEQERNELQRRRPLEGVESDRGARCRTVT